MELIKNKLNVVRQLPIIIAILFLSQSTIKTFGQVNVEIGGGIGQINWGGKTYYKARYTVVFPELLLENKLGFYFTLESTGSPKYSKPIDNWGVTYKFHPNISAYYGHALFHMQTDRPELFPFTGRQDLGISINPNNLPINIKLGYAFWVGPTFQVTYKILNKEGVDTDHDGVRNRFDKCKQTDPRFVSWVNNQGCLVDTDGDEVPDVIDSCKTTFGLALVNGCPDQDKDLVADKFDKCPDVPGLAEFKGCLAPVDSIIRNTDTIRAIDNSPIATFVPADPKLAELLKDATPLFVYDNYSLLPNFQKKLIPVVSYMKKNPTAELILIGHTDKVGTEEYNISLSLNRALEVKKFLVFKGIKPNRITTFGNGTSSPLYLDNSETARMANRRVELIIK